MSSRSETDTVAARVENGIAWVRFNRPEKRNCMSPALNRQMLRVISDLEFRDDVGILVLTGEGTAWSAGMDLKEYFRDTEAQGLAGVRHSQREAYAWWERLRWYQKVTIAMVNGWCFGGAFSPLVACDLAIAADEAVFGLSEINWGIPPGNLVSKGVADTMGHRNALYYIMTGETFDGRRAAEMGLVNKSVPRARLKEETTAVARLLLNKNPVALRAAKVGFKRCRELTWEQAEDYLYAKVDQSNYRDPEKGREKGLKQFLDEKSIRPGLQTYKR